MNNCYIFIIRVYTALLMLTTIYKHSGDILLFQIAEAMQLIAYDTPGVEGKHFDSTFIKIHPPVQILSSGNKNLTLPTVKTLTSFSACIRVQIKFLFTFVLHNSC